MKSKRKIVVDEVVNSATSVEMFEIRLHALKQKCEKKKKRGVK